MAPLVKTDIVSGVVIKQDGKYLLVQENRQGTDVHGMWNFPAGKVEEGDTIEETALKEAKEEVGYDVALICKLDIFHERAHEPVKHAFEAKIIGGELAWPQDEILDARWFTWQEIQGMQDKLRSEWIIGAVQLMEDSESAV